MCFMYKQNKKVKDEFKNDKITLIRRKKEKVDSYFNECYVYSCKYKKKIQTCKNSIL